MSDAAHTVYQLRVVLAGISPMVWRLLLVDTDTTMAGLHETQQTVFGWSEEALGRDRIGRLHFQGFDNNDTTEVGDREYPWERPSPAAPAAVEIEIGTPPSTESSHS